MEELQQNYEYLVLQHKLAFMLRTLKEFEDRRIKWFKYEQKPIGSL
jgi:hypothetical protein